MLSFTVSPSNSEECPNIVRSNTVQSVLHVITQRDAKRAIVKLQMILLNLGDAVNTHTDDNGSSQGASTTSSSKPLKNKEIQPKPAQTAASSIDHHQCC
jgi:hypothetical protein